MRRNFREDRQRVFDDTDTRILFLAAKARRELGIPSEKIDWKQLVVTVREKYELGGIERDIDWAEIVAENAGSPRYPITIKDPQGTVNIHSERDVHLESGTLPSLLSQFVFNFVKKRGIALLNPINAAMAQLREQHQQLQLRSVSNSESNREVPKPIPQSPVFTAKTTPVFQWASVPGAKAYDVSILKEDEDGLTEIIWEGSTETEMELTVPTDVLERGQIYFWQVSALIAEQSTHSPLVGFWILDSASVRQVESEAKNYPNSTLVLASIYAAHGLYEQALGEVEKLVDINPTNQVVAEIYANLLRWLGRIEDKSTSPALKRNDEAEIRDVVKQFFDAYTRRDLDDLMQLWSEDSPNFANQKDSMQQVFAENENIELKSLDVVKFKLSGDKAKVHLVAEMTATDAHTATPSEDFGRKKRTLDLVKAKRLWKVWQYMPTEQDLADALIATETKDEQTKLINEERESITTDLAINLYKASSAQAKRGKFKEALRYADIILEVAETLNDKAISAYYYQCRGIISYYQSEYSLALENFQTALPLHREVMNTRGESATLNNIGVIFKSTGMYVKALEFYEASFKIGDKEGEVGYFLNMGNILRLMGKNAKALEASETAFKIATEIGNRNAVASIRNNMGTVYRETGQVADASEMFEASLKIAKELSDERGIAVALTHKGEVYHETGQYPEALKVYKASLKIHQTLDNKKGEQTTYMGIGNTFGAMGLYPEALEAFRKSHAIAKKINDKQAEGRAFANMGALHRKMKQFQKALTQYEAAREICESIGDIEAVFRVNLGIGLIYLAQGQWDEATIAFETAIKLIEQVREDTREPLMQIGFFQRFTAPYVGLVTSLASLKQTEEAFETAERAKARTLVELLAGNHSEITKFMTTDEKRREQELNERIMLANLGWRALENQEQLNPDRLDAAKQYLASARRAYDTFRRQMYIKYPQLEAQRGKFSPLTVAQAKQWLATEGGVDLLVLEYVVGDDQTWLFALNENSELSVSSIPLTRQEIEQQINDLQSGMLEVGKGEDANASILAKLKPALQKLEMLVAPASHMLSQASQVCIVPDDLLWNVPFAAIKTAENKYLIETHTVFYAPSVTALKAQVEARKKCPPATGQLLAMAPFATTAAAGTISPRKLPLRGEFGPLKYSDEEVKAVSALFGETAPFLGKDATETVAKLKASEASILHFATHGLFDESYGLNSGILFAEEQGEDGYLEAREILDLDLNAELVVLSACETARGQLSHGEGIIGLSWAFFVAGCSSTVVSQWKVADESTVKLMTGFYENLKEGKNKDEALRQAQLSLLSQPEWKHPFYWAPFILVGNWQSASSE